MAWVFNTWSSITTYSGKTLKVMVAAGAIIGGGTLYWWDRAEPNYPAAQDEAVLWAGAQERHYVYYNSDHSNSVTYYALKSEGADVYYLASLAAKVAAWIISKPDNAGISDDELDNFANTMDSLSSMDSYHINNIWWTNNFGLNLLDFPPRWSFYFETNAPLYVTKTNYNETAKLISSLRATLTTPNVEMLITYYRRGDSESGGVFTNRLLAWENARDHLLLESDSIFTNYAAYVGDMEETSVLQRGFPNYSAYIIQTSTYGIISTGTLPYSTNDEIWISTVLRQPFFVYYTVFDTMGRTDIVETNKPRTMVHNTINAWTKDGDLTIFTVNDRMSELGWWTPTYLGDLNSTMRGWIVEDWRCIMRYDFQYLTNVADFWP